MEDGENLSAVPVNEVGVTAVTEGTGVVELDNIAEVPVRLLG